MTDTPATTEDRVREFCLTKGDQTIYPSDVADTLGIAWHEANAAMESLRAKGKLQHAE